MNEEEKWHRFVAWCGPSGGSFGYAKENEDREGIAWAAAELTRLRAIVARVEDVEGMAKSLANSLSNNWALGDVEQNYWRTKARAVRDYLVKEG